MNYAITVELQFFFISILWGGILLLVYDCLRIFRRLIKHAVFFVAIEDLIFWIAASLLIFSMMYRENDGIIRGFSVMGMSIGMVLYHYIISEYLVKLITKLIRTLFKPFSIAWKKVKQFTQFLMKRIKKGSNFLLRRLKKWMKSVKIALNRKKQVQNAKRQKKNQQKIARKKKKEEEKQSKRKSSVEQKEKYQKNKKKTNPKQKEADSVGNQVARTGHKQVFERYQKP